MTGLLEVATYGGPVTALAIVFLYFNDKKDQRKDDGQKKVFKEVINVVKKNTVAFQKTDNTITHLTEIIKKFNGFKK